MLVNIRLMLVLWFVTIPTLLLHAQIFKPAYPDTTGEKTKWKAYLAMTGGVAKPLGEFANNTFENIHSGFAKTGRSFTYIHFGLIKANRYGIGFQWQRNRYLFDVEGLLAPYRQESPGFEFSGRAEEWVCWSFPVNVFLTVPGNLVDVEFRIHAGPISMKRPKLVIMYSDTTLTPREPWTWVQLENTQRGWAFGGGINLRLHVVEGVDLFLCADYQRAKIDFKVRNEYESLSYKYTTFYNYWYISQAMEVMSFGAGLGFYIW